MDKLIKELEEEREKFLKEAKKYPAGDKRNMYYVGCACGIGRILSKIKKTGEKGNGKNYVGDNK